MADERWTAVDDYYSGLLAPPDAALTAALRASDHAGLPEIQIEPMFGKLLAMFVRLVDARQVLELGTLGGYSTIWLARALAPGGRVTTLELKPDHAEVAAQNVALAGVADLVDIRVGPALDTLAQLSEDGAGPYDLIFIDADKRRLPAYVEWALRLSRPGSLIVVDNVVRDGRVVDETSADPDVLGVRTLAQMLADDPRLDATVVQTVGGKGYDGFAVALVAAE